MIAPDLQSVSIFVRPGITDMRKAANGLSLVIENLMEKDPGSGNLYLFCNREKKLIKCLWWDCNGFWLAQKRLEKGRFPWPNTEEEAQLITPDQLAMLLSGIDFWNAHQSIEYRYMN
jgi:transposase